MYLCKRSCHSGRLQAELGTGRVRLSAAARCTGAGSLDCSLSVCKNPGVVRTGQHHDGARLFTLTVPRVEYLCPTRAKINEIASSETKELNYLMRHDHALDAL